MSMGELAVNLGPSTSAFLLHLHHRSHYGAYLVSVHHFNSLSGIVGLMGVRSALLLQPKVRTLLIANLPLSGMLDDNSA